MDKIVLKPNDIEMLLKWRDQNKDLVRQNPCPMKSIEIVCPHNGYRIKGFRESGYLKLHLNQDGKSLGSTEFMLTENNFWSAVANKHKMKTDRDGLQSVLTVYCSLMALIAFAPHARQKVEDEIRPLQMPGATGKPKKNQSPGITYLLIGDAVQSRGTKHRSHSSPKGEFSVRGHYRRYKSGKTVWIDEFRKGTGKKSKKEYRIHESKTN